MVFLIKNINFTHQTSKSDGRLLYCAYLMFAKQNMAELTHKQAQNGSNKLYVIVWLNTNSFKNKQKTGTVDQS